MSNIYQLVVLPASDVRWNLNSSFLALTHHAVFDITTQVQYSTQ